jgi:hypothetical protein
MQWHHVQEIWKAEEEKLLALAAVKEHLAGA